MGIGMPDKKNQSDVTDYVLASFNAPEKKELKSIFKRAEEGCRLWAVQSTSAAMNVVNQGLTAC